MKKCISFDFLILEINCFFFFFFLFFYFEQFSDFSCFLKSFYFFFFWLQYVLYLFLLYLFLPNLLFFVMVVVIIYSFIFIMNFDIQTWLYIAVIRGKNAQPLKRKKWVCNALVMLNQKSLMSILFLIVNTTPKLLFLYHIFVWFFVLFLFFYTASFSYISLYLLISLIYNLLPDETRM